MPIDRVFATRVLSDLELSADTPVPHIVNELFRLTRRAARRPAARWMLSPPAVTSVRELAVRLAMPARSLLDLAYRDIGLSPKRMLRIVRLHAALHASRRLGNSWASVAFEAGYADQAHLSRELRALLGEAPSTWASRGSRRFVQDTGCGMR